MGKFKVRVLFGEYAADLFQYTKKTPRSAKYCARKYGGDIIEHDFETEAEKSAYIMALEESNGWGRFVCF